MMGRKTGFPVIAAGLIIIIQACSSAPEKKKDAREEYFKKIEHFIVLEEIAAEAMVKEDTMTETTYLFNLRKTALTDWAECVNLFDEAKTLDLPPALEKNRKQMWAYADHRVQQTLLMIRAAEEKTGKYDKSIDSIGQKIKQLVDEIKENSDLQQQTDKSRLLPLRQL